MDFVLSLLGMVALMTVAYAVPRLIIFKVRWHLFGWRPAIFDKETVAQTVSECSDLVLDKEFQEAEDAGIQLTVEQKRERLARVKQEYRRVIERYIETFSTWR